MSEVLMRKQTVRILGAGFLIWFCSNAAHAQFPEDALRFATPGVGVGARALGMGNAFTGIANDFSALYWNPAGLTQIRFSEFSVGLGHLNTQSASLFSGTTSDYSINSTSLNSIGFVLPVPTKRGSMVIALGYQRPTDFSTGISFERFNTGTSLIQTFAPNGALAPANPAGNVAYELFLADIDSVTGRWINPVTGNLQEMEKALEGGGLNQWSAGGGIEVAPNISAGMTLTYLSGQYRYDGTYTESDIRRIYETSPYDFERFIIEDNIRSDITGFNAKFGLLIRKEDQYRVGIGIKTPTGLRVKETFGTDYRSLFDNGDSFGPLTDRGETEYDISTPWVFSGGVSVLLNSFMLSADVEYTDWTQLEFTKGTQDLLSYNRTIKDLFVGTANINVGGEYELKNIGLRLRAGFMLHPSPYRGDPSSFDQKFVTGGVGIQLSEAAMFDISYAYGFWDTFRDNYDASARVDDQVRRHNVLATLSFRY